MEYKVTPIKTVLSHIMNQDIIEGLETIKRLNPSQFEKFPIRKIPISEFSQLEKLPVRKIPNSKILNYNFIIL